MQTPVNAPVTLLASFKPAAVKPAIDENGVSIKDGGDAADKADIKYMLFGAGGLLLIAAEVFVIILKKRSEKQ